MTTIKRKPRTQSVEELQDKIKALGRSIKWQPDKLSTLAESFENLMVTGSYKPFTYEDDPNAPQAFFLPGNIRASYLMADRFYRLEGDVAAAIEAPIQVGMKSLDIQCPDPGVKAELEALYDVDGLNMASLLRYAMLSMSVFGIAHPAELWDEDQPDELHGVILLPPIYTSVGSHLSGTYISPFDNSKEWTGEALKTLLPQQMYLAVRNLYENKPVGRLQLPDDMVHSIRGLDNQWMNYPKPLLQGAFRAISTRIIYEEMRRAVYEGFRHQLWLFLLGDAEHPPSVDMMTKLASDVDGMNGERTGSLAWWGALKVDVKTPVTADILKSEEWWMLSLDIFRRMGLNQRMSTGNTMPADRGGGFDVDVSIMLEKYEYFRQAMVQWVRGFNLRYGKKSGKGLAWMKAVRDTNVVFSQTKIEAETEIAKILTPLFTIGALSVQTLHQKAQLNYEVERANKQAVEQAGEQGLWFAPPSYNQTATSDGGQTKSVTSQPEGRPNTDKSRMVASVQGEIADKRKKYLELILAIYLAHLHEPDVFIDELKAANVKELKDFSDFAYKTAGGVHQSTPEPWADSASAFVNSFADKFGADMKSGEPGHFDNQKRALMYGVEGFSTAVLHGIQAAMKERGADKWRRVLHASLSGPCPECIADSQILHDIDEAFVSLHNNENCTAAPVKVMFTRGANATVEFGVPGFTTNDMTPFLQEAGITEIDHRVRRKRSP